MRITNAMMTNNTLRNINMNKITTDKLNTQLTTGKKIQNASDDPIIAIRALRFRSELSELEQYLKKNIKDARSWMQLTEDALVSMGDMLSSTEKYLEQGVTGSYDTLDKQTIVDTLVRYGEQILQDANATYSGRSIFTGYKTNSTMTFTATDKDIRYDITETFNPSDLDTVMTVSNSVDVNQVASVADADMPSQNTTYRLRLAYDKITPENLDIKWTDENGGTNSVTAEALVYDAAQKAYVDLSGTVVMDDPYKLMADDTSGDRKAYFLADSGEVIMNTAAYKAMKGAYSADPERKPIEVTYSKTGFEKGELRPENYFTCTSTTTDGVVKKIEYTAATQDINYSVNFNQTLNVNTEGRDVFNHDMVRDLEELVNVTQNAIDVEEKIEEIKKMQTNSIYDNEDDQAKLSSMLEAANKELDYAKNMLQTKYAKAQTIFKGYSKTVNSEISDIGSRAARLTLNETRLSDQQTSLEELKSTNEDADEVETAINLTTAETIYEASLAAAGKLLSTSLLDYI